jgi:hypothetical protein
MPGEFFGEFVTMLYRFDMQPLQNQPLCSSIMIA